MTSYVWFGGTGNWSDAGDWSPAGVPNAATASVRIDSGHVTISGSYAIGSLALSGSATTLSIGSAGSLETSKRLDLTDGAITGSGTLKVDGTDNVFAGSSNHQAAITGLSVTINGVSTFDNLMIGGGATVTNRATINAVDRVTIGAAKLINAAPSAQDGGGTYVLEASSSLVGAATAHFYNYGTFIKAGGTGSSSVGINFTDTGNIVVSQGTLAFYGAASFSGSIAGPGTLLLEGGPTKNASPISQTLGTGANLGVYFVIMAKATAASSGIPSLAADNLTVAAGTNVRCSSVFEEQAGTTLTIETGAALILTGGPATNGLTTPDGKTTTSFAGTIAGGGRLVFAGGNQSLDAGVKLSGTTLSMSGNDSLRINTSILYTRTFTQGTGTTLTIANSSQAATKFTLTGTATLAGVVAGTGTLNLAGGSQSLNQGASLDVAAVVISKPASGTETLTVNASVDCSSAFTQASGTILNVGASGTLTFTGGKNVTLGGTTNLATAAGIATNGQTLNITGTLNIDSVTAAFRGSDGFPRGGGHHHVTVKHAVIKGGVLARSAGLDVDGYLTFSSTGSVSVSNATLNVTAGGMATVGALQVATDGTVNFAGGKFTLTVPTGGANTLNGNINLMGGTLETGTYAITIAGPFSQSSDSTLDGSGVLTFKGQVNFTDSSGTAVETGTGTTLLQNSTTVSGNLALDGGRILENAGGATLTWKAGDFYLGLNPIGTTVGGGVIMNDAGATFSMQSDGVVARGAGTTDFVNYGTIIKNTAGTTTIATSIGNGNTGVIQVQQGVLDITGTVRGHGMIEIDGGSLQLESTLTPNQQVKFTSNGGDLNLTDGTAFTGYITGFGANPKDTIDLTGPGFGVGYANTTLSYTGNTKEGVLTITDGKLQAKLILFGDYVAAGFHKSAYAGGGTTITYVPPAATHPQLAPGH